MKALRNLACAAVMAAVICASAGVATASEEDIHVNHGMAPGVWYSTWIGPSTSEFGAPDMGTNWQKDFTGEVTYVDSKYLTVDIDGAEESSVDFYLYEGNKPTVYTPSHAAIRVGSKVEVRADDRNRARFVRTVPFYQWLKNQGKNE